MLANLIFNAVDAMPAGGTITVRARLDGAGVRLEVSDTGTGMSDEVRQRCLEPFFTTKSHHGTGLGLSLVHSTVQRHGGALTIDSAPGRGTTFIVRLPLQDEPPTAGATVASLTGFGDLMVARGEHPSGVDAVVGKPVTLDALTQAIHKVTVCR